MDDRGVAEELSLLRVAVESMRAPPANPVMAVDYVEAARILGFKSSKTISRMVGSGQIVAVKLGRTWMVPMMELQRITTPKLPVRIAKRQPAPRLNAAEEEARGLAMLKRR